MNAKLLCWTKISPPPCVPPLHPRFPYLENYIPLERCVLIQSKSESSSSSYISVPNCFYAMKIEADGMLNMSRTAEQHRGTFTDLVSLLPQKGTIISGIMTYIAYCLAGSAL